MSSRHLLRIAALGALGAGCGGGVSVGSAPGVLTAPDGGSSVTGPYDITCTMYFQPGRSNREESFSVRSDVDAAKTMTFPGYTIEAAFAPSSEAPLDAALTVSVRETETVQRFRLARDRRPASQFGGGHGFTGLVYVGEGLQYICAAPEPASGPAAQAPASQSPSPSVAPFRVGCVVEVRSTPGGALERSETVEITDATLVRSESADIAAAADRALDLGDFGWQVRFMDDIFGGRSMILSAWKKPGSEHAGNIRQLFQLSRSAPIVNQLSGGSFSGRTTVGNAPGRELSYACESR